MKKTLIIFLALIAIGFVFYKNGPKPEKPNLEQTYKFELPSNLDDLEKFISDRESIIPGIKTPNEADFVWANDSAKAVTPYAIVYIHGFSASHIEGAPVHENLAKRYNANLYKARLSEHGIDLGDETMANMNADDYIASAEEALAIGKKIGQKVILVGTSAGGALTTYLASKHPELEAIVLYSPCIKIYDDNAELLDNPWGRDLAELIQGKPFNDITPKNDDQPKYWTMHYRLEGVVALQNFLTHAMTPETFNAVKCPVFMGYYYKDEEHQDNVVSVPAMLKMFDQLGSADKTKMAFPEANNHVLASWVLSEDVETVQHETEKFLDRIIKQ
ncbi:alpha/beta hydrolase [Arcticibacterium luteifluviistationis]|uniref:Alpha/beta hydrolase n=1 Tax=Arcticibacterium luteifluviistationis TaxID=1784714 RepID=A0A2Z4G7Z5_9BACT|nr:alpha/beta hydrolase [Arcticibacterium luteifluviistationis]AWV97319.1 alpha/beta hydrolase [Arcticibacterium luteifluviistationis]